MEVGGPQPARALGAGAGLSPGWALPTPACAPPSWLQTLGAGSSGAASRPDPPALRTALPGGLGAQPTGPQGPWLCSSFSPHPLLTLTRVGRVQAPAHSAWAPAPTSGSQAVPPNPIPAPQAAVAEPLVGPQDPEATRWAPVLRSPLVPEFQRPRAWRPLSCYSLSLNCLFFSLTLWISRDSESSVFHRRTREGPGQCPWWPWGWTALGAGVGWPLLSGCVPARSRGGLAQALSRVPESPE